jgi:hypothetical protein
MLRPPPARRLTCARPAERIWRSRAAGVVADTPGLSASPMTNDEDAGGFEEHGPPASRASPPCCQTARERPGTTIHEPARNWLHHLRQRLPREADQQMGDGLVTERE